MRKQLQDFLEKRIQHYVSASRDEEISEQAQLKIDACTKRSAEIVKVKATGKILEKVADEEFSKAKYQLHFQYLIKQKGTLFIEEEVEQREAKFYKNVLVEDNEIIPDDGSIKIDSEPDLWRQEEENDDRGPFEYNRLRAVQYAERWWNDYNPAYRKFQNDCTSFISQCLHAGGVPMRGYPNRQTGWWIKGQNYSYSWAVANSLRLFLDNSKSGLGAKLVSRPELLLPGDVICYDFQGDGRFDHNTIVVAKDANGMPLVNAHTYNSRMRYWAYTDSTAYTPNIKYKFYSILGGR